MTAQAYNTTNATFSDVADCIKWSDTTLITISVAIILVATYLQVGFSSTLNKNKRRSSLRNRPSKRELCLLSLVQFSVTALTGCVIIEAILCVILTTTWHYKSSLTWSLITAWNVFEFLPKIFTYLFLWTRQWIFYSSPILPYSSNKIFMCFNVLLLVIAIGNSFADSVFNVLDILPPNELDCTQDDVEALESRGFTIYVQLLLHITTEVSMMGLFCYPLMGRKKISKDGQHKRKKMLPVLKRSLFASVLHFVCQIIAMVIAQQPFRHRPEIGVIFQIAFYVTVLSFYVTFESWRKIPMFFKHIYASGKQDIVDPTATQRETLTGVTALPVA